MSESASTDASPSSSGPSGPSGPVKCKTAAELTKLRLDRLMQNPSRPVLIPEQPKVRQFKPPPEFVRDVMGSSAGAGSGEFHVYRATRRREYARQDFLDRRSAKDDADEAFHAKLEENKKKAEEKTARKRAKRERKKQKAKLKKMTRKEGEGKEEKEDEEEEEEEEEEEPHFVIGGK